MAREFSTARARALPAGAAESRAESGAASARMRPAWAVPHEHAAAVQAMRRRGRGAGARGVAGMDASNPARGGKTQPRRDRCRRLCASEGKDRGELHGWSEDRAVGCPDGVSAYSALTCAPCARRATW